MSALARWCFAGFFATQEHQAPLAACLPCHAGDPALPPAEKTLTRTLRRHLWLCLATAAGLQLCLPVLNLACTAGLGIFEYMLLAEELKAEPVWVFNSGNSHTESIPNDKLHPFVEDVLQSIEFVTGAMLWRMPVDNAQTSR